MQRKKYEMQRFDLYIPQVAARIIEIEADKRGLPARTYGRVLLLEKVKELAGIAPDQALPTHISEVPLYCQLRQNDVDSGGDV